MYTRLFLIGIAAIILSCKKENDSLTQNKSAAELLTQNPWMLVSYGYDENRNGIIDPSEETIEDCQKDNHWYFYPDGTGLFDDNTLSCANGIDRQPFSWRFINNEAGIDFFCDPVKILSLNEQELITCKELTYSNGNTIKFMILFRH